MRGQWLVAGVLVLAPVAGHAQQGSRATAGADTEAAQQQDAATAKVLRADQRPETAAVQKLAVTSSSFASDGPIPNKYSSYGESVSPNIAWLGGPAAKSFAVIMEDPEGHAAEPVAHWVVWNIPPATRSLPEGLPKQGRLTQPAGAVQGKTTSGALGYMGRIRPPATPRTIITFRCSRSTPRWIFRPEAPGTRWSPP
jgi:Raf kinase inhibitor-like YbhB/YbcL family protein